MLYGMYDFDGGEVIVKGEPLTQITPRLAIEKGIGWYTRNLCW